MERFITQVIGEESYCGNAWLYELRSVPKGDGTFNAGIYLAPKTTAEMPRAIACETFAGSKAEVLQTAVARIRDWSSVRGLIQQYLGSRIAVPEEPPSERNLVIYSID